MQMQRGPCAVVASLAILAGTCLQSVAAESRWAGYLFDRSCADSLKAQRVAPDEHHKKECALNESCSRDGYAIYSKGQWYRLDKKGSQQARHLLETTKTSEGHFVVVSGTLEKGEIKVSTLREVARQE